MGRSTVARAQQARLPSQTGRLASMMPRTSPRQQDQEVSRWHRRQAATRRTAATSDIKDVLLTEREVWEDGVPHELFARMRKRMPRALDLGDHRISRGGRLLVGDHGRGRADGEPRLQDLLLGSGGRDGRQHRLPDRALARDVHRHGPAQARPREGAVPGGLHAQADRRPRGCHPRDHRRSAGPPGGTRDVRPRQRRRPAGRLARDRQLHGHPAGGRRDLGAADELHAGRGRPRPEPARGHPGGDRKEHRGDLRALPAS